MRQFTFSAGELAPSLYARVDTSRYATGLRTMRNFWVMKSGGSQNRPGSSFVGEVKDSTKAIRLLPFVFSADQTYVLEFGNLYMRVIRNGSQVLEATKAVTGATQANPCQLTVVAHAYATGEEVYVSGVGGMTQLNNRNFKVVNTGANTFTLQYMNGTAVNSTAFGAYTTGGVVARVYTIVTPYLEADLPDLDIAQSADVITIAHPSYAPRELSRTGHTSWTLAAITFGPETDPTTVTVPGGPGITEYAATVIDDTTGEESNPAYDVGAFIPTTTSPVIVTLSAVAGAREYNVWRRGVNPSYGFGFLGAFPDTTINDNGLPPDFSSRPPIAVTIFSGANNFPSTVAYYQQRRIFGNTNNQPETVFASAIGYHTNFNYSVPLVASDAATFSLAGKQVNRVKHLIDLGRLIVFTDGAEWAIQGDSAGTLTPTDVNPKQYSYNGSSSLPPLVINETALYVQARGSIVRDLGFEFQSDGYRGNDLTIFSTHLFDGFTLVDWTYQRVPNSIAWSARSDGTLLGLTYVREQQIIGWHRHDTDGLYENVCSVPEGSEDALYAVVVRDIGGTDVRYIERFESRRIADIVDSIFVDSSLTYDGRNETATTMTLSGGVTWADTETLTITASAAFFTAADVGNAIHLTGSDGTVIRFALAGFSSTTVMTGNSQKIVPVVMRTTAIVDWSRAVDQVTGLWHLEGRDVSVFADGFVIASPNNSAYTTVTVTGGTVTLARPYAVISIGLPYISDIETLDIDLPQGETLSDKKKFVTELNARVETSRAFWSGPNPPSDDDVDPLENLYELKTRASEDMESSPELQTEVVQIKIQPQWNSNGRVFLRNTEPAPVSILSIMPAGLFPARG